MDFDNAEELRIARNELKYWQKIRREKRGMNKHENIPWYEIDQGIAEAENQIEILETQQNLDEYVKQKGWTQKDLDRMANEHIRIPYKKNKGSR